MGGGGGKGHVDVEIGVGVAVFRLSIIRIGSMREPEYISYIPFPPAVCIGVTCWYPVQILRGIARANTYIHTYIPCIEHACMHPIVHYIGLSGARVPHLRAPTPRTREGPETDIHDAIYTYFLSKKLSARNQVSLLAAVYKELRVTKCASTVLKGRTEIQTVLPF